MKRAYPKGPMRLHITAQQLIYFQQNGEIFFENFPFEISTPEKGRDLWRRNPEIKKLITTKVGPIVLELSGKAQLRLACDQWIEAPLPNGMIQEMFCFQGLAAVCILEQNTLRILHPSHLNSKIQTPCYLVAFAQESARLIANPKDPFAAETRNLGYVYGDKLTHALHPLITRR